MTAERAPILTGAAELLLDARQNGRPLDGIAPEMMPHDLNEVYAIQDKLAAAFGDIGGWKIGAPTPDDTPFFAPMPRAWMAAEGSTLRGPHWRYRGCEAEIAFLVGEDLPARAQPYTREEVLSAMASCHPAIEILETAFAHPTDVPRLAMLADLQLHGGFVYGAAYTAWRDVDFSKETVALEIDGIVRVERTGSNTSGDLLKLLPWLANEGAARTGGLRAGQWITTGSWTGSTPADSTSSVTAEFSHVGRVDLYFG